MSNYKMSMRQIFSSVGGDISLYIKCSLNANALYKSLLQANTAVNL